MSQTLSEARSKSMLASYGVPVLAERVVGSASDAAVAATELGFPVVAKLCGDGITHKTERGLVRLGLGTPEAVSAATTDLLDAATADDGEVAVLVAPMVSGIREFIAGLHLDPQFGMTVMVGIGGVLAEAVADVAIRLVPITELDAAEMIDELRSQPILGAPGGEPAVDRAALIAVLIGLSAASQAHPEIVSADLNPLIISDGHPIAVDALVEIADQPDGHSTVGVSS